MLEPGDRRLFLQALRPPEGYSFDTGIGTTFSLDLYSLLVVPLSLAFLDYENPEQAFQNPLILLESLRRYSKSLTIFCQAGRIQVPSKNNLLISFLEKMVVEAKAPRGGVFHPKFWLLRYTSKDGPPIYRLLNLTRNLTFDRSWDLMVSLEGEVSNRKRGFSRNQPIADFIRALPDMATRKLNSASSQTIKHFQNEVMRVDFQSLDDFESLEFLPMGIPKYAQLSFPNDIDRLMVVSPFVSDDFLSKQTQQGNGHILISRTESLDQLSSKTRKRFGQIFFLNDLVTEDLDEGNTEQNKKRQSDSTEAELSGLHAKLFVWESRWRAGWFLGSANATSAAFHKNVEFVIGLNGKKGRIGIDATLGDANGRNAFMNILSAYTESGTSLEIDREQKETEDLANAIRSWLIDSNPFLEIMHSKENDNYRLALNFKSAVKPVLGKYKIQCWPISIDKSHCQTIKFAGQPVSVYFNQVSLTSLTTFFAFEVTATIKKISSNIQFVLILPVSGMPEERDDVVLSSILSDHSQFMRYLQLLLLGGDTGIKSDLALFSLMLGKESSSLLSSEKPLLEELTLALSRSNHPGGKIDQIDDLVRRLRRTPQAQNIIPAEFDALWEMILQAREKIQ